MRQVKVLLVEDNDFMRSTVAAALRSEHCDIVASVRSSREALVAASEKDVECAVIDLNLGPGPSGIDLAHALRRGDPKLGVVLLTSYADPRLLSSEQRPVPAGTVYSLRNDIHSTAQLREKIDIALREVSRPQAPFVGRLPLTDMQMDLLRMVAAGMTNAEIAKRRVVSERAVETALSRTARALGITVEAGENPRSMLIRSYYALTSGLSDR